MTLSQAGGGGRQGSFWLALAPILFVLLWSTGFIGAKLGLPYASPLLFLAIRFVASTLLLTFWVLAAKERWPRGFRVYLDLAVVGTLFTRSTWAPSTSPCPGVWRPAPRH